MTALSSCPPASAGGLYALLEQLNAGLSCSNPHRPWLVGVSDQERRAILIRPDCKQWSCPQCSHWQKLHWTHRIAYGVDHYQRLGEHWHFGTLTARKDRRGFDRSLSDWRASWPKLLLRIKRLRGDKVFRYVMVPEEHTDRTLHMHVIWNHGFGAKHRVRKDGSEVWASKWLADNCSETGLGYIHDCRPCKSEIQAALYVSKYISKSLHVIDWPPYLRRIRTSQGWPQLPSSDDSDQYEWDAVPNSRLTSVALAYYVPPGYAIQIGKSTLIL